MALKAVIFDLDGVITDTAEYHYLAWQQLADEEGLSFSRAENEKLRGVSRRDSLLLILKGQVVAEEKLQAMMARKNRYYTNMLHRVTPADLLPGVDQLLDQLDVAGIPYAIASASKNAADVVNRLGITHRLAALADGNSVAQQKPAPHLFRFAAARLGIMPHHCLVVEDAEAGIEAALAAGMAALALGPAERFGGLLQQPQVIHREHLQQVTVAELETAVQPNPTWVITQTAWQPTQQHHMETIFTTGNGYFASRGSLEEGFPGDVSLTFAHGIYDDMPIVRTELVNLPNWLDLEMQVNGFPFRLDKGQLLHFYRQLDMRQGVLRRALRWQSPDGAVLDITFERFASYAQEQVGAIRVLVTAVSHPVSLTLHTGINGHVANENLLHWQLGEQGVTEDGTIWLQSHTKHTHIELVTAARVETAVSTPTCQQCPGHPRYTLTHHLQPGQTLLLDKLTSYTSSRDPGTTDSPLARAHRALQNQSYHHLKQTHIAAWGNVWDDCDVVIEGDNEAQLAVRFSLFQLLVAAPQHDERVSIGAKTLSGFGYRGHVFWDTEIFVLPFFSYTRPTLARNMLMYRYHTLPGARRKAQGNGFLGAQYAWESAETGDEVTPTWVPDFSGTGLVRIWTGDIEIHITADIVYALWQHWQITGDNAFMHDYGAEIILDSARFWASRAEHEQTENGYRYALRDVIGPDEYHDHVDNNAYTNRMAQWHLQTALTILDWLTTHYPQKADDLTRQLNLTPNQLARWQDVADHLILNHNPETGLMLQFDDFFQRKPVEWDVFAARTKSMQFLLGIEEANASQVIKQADVIMLLCLLRDQYDTKTWQINWDTYMPLTDHSYGSSLGPSFHAWAACEMNRPDEAYEHFMLAARADLRDIRGNAGEGIHAASAGGLWQAIAFGFAGLRLTPDGYTINPRLPAHWRRVMFKFYRHGKRQVIDIQK